jgi:hypothetical protein
MTLILDLRPEVEHELTAKARAMGVSLAGYAEQIRAREASAPAWNRPRKSLVQFFRESPLVGLELEFERDQDTGRDVTL